MTATRQDAEVERVADAMHSAAIRLLRMLRKEDAASGLTGPQLSALSVLVFAGPLKLGALAAAEQISLPTASRLVTELERRGLSTRVMDPADRRATIIAVTEAGRDLLQTGRRLRLRRLVQSLNGLSAEERALLAEASRLILSLNEPG